VRWFLLSLYVGAVASVHGHGSVPRNGLPPWRHCLCTWPLGLLAVAVAMAGCLTQLPGRGHGWLAQRAGHDHGRHVQRHISKN